MPTYPPGVPLLMAAARLIGRESAGCLVVPLPGLLVLAVSAATAWQLGGTRAARCGSRGEGAGAGPDHRPRPAQRLFVVVLRGAALSGRTGNTASRGREGTEPCA